MTGSHGITAVLGRILTTYPDNERGDIARPLGLDDLETVDPR